MKNVRRRDREISLEEAVEILAAAEYGVLSTVDNYGQPYGIPLNYVYKDSAIYFHCAVDGQKFDNIVNNARVSFCVVGSTKVLPESFGTLYESAVVFGHAYEALAAERHNALVWLLDKYCSDYLEGGLQYIELKEKAIKVIKIEISKIRRRESRGVPR